MRSSANPPMMNADVMIAQIVVYDGTGSNVPTAPSNWVLIRDDSVQFGNLLTSWLYYHVVTSHASEPTTYTWTISPQYAAAVIGDWRGAAVPDPIDKSSGAFQGGGVGRSAEFFGVALIPSSVH